MAAGALLTLTLTLGVSLSLLTTAHCGVFVVAPNIFNANEQETVSVLVLKGLARALVKVTVQSNGQIHDSDSKVITKGTQKKFDVRVDGSKLGAPDTNGQYYVQLRVQRFGYGSSHFDRTTDILVNKRTGTVFLQTDKPIYSPGQTVSIQVFALTERRKAANISIKVEVKNPNGITISRKTGETRIGLFTDELKIPSLPVHGKWKIAVHFGSNFSESREKQIEIKKYVLPHFQVRLTKYPDYIKSINEAIEGNFEAKYSFDANVLGNARVVFRVVTHGEAIYLTDKSYLLSYGRAKFTLTPADMSTLNLTSLLTSKSHLQTEIIVTESSTGIKESIIVPKCRFVNSPYVISFGGTMAYFTPGLPFQVKITVRNIRGEAVPHARLKISATDQHNHTVSMSSKVASGRMTNTDGVISYYFDMNQIITTIRVKVNVEGDLEKAEHVTHRANMPGYMKISPYNAHILQPGAATVFEAVLTNWENLERLHFMLVSGGRIFDVGHKEQPDMTMFTFSRHISYDNAPSVRIVAWYFRNDTKELVAASSKLQVERKCKTQAEVKRSQPTPKFLKPGDNCYMVYKGTIGAKVITMVVDKAVYFMNNGSRLTQKSFFDEFETRDLGCAVGGGSNATDVFALAGLTILSDTISHPRRESLNCTQTTGSPVRHKRSTVVQDPDDDTCCNTGERFANTSQIILSGQRRRMACFTAASKYTSRSCKNSFGRCCVKRATARTNNGQDHSRTQNDDEDIQFEMCEDESDVTPRTDFPESWNLLSDMKIESEGKVEKEVEMPGSITTWVFQAVTMSTTEGMCVAEPFEQIVRKEVFVKVHLPQSAVLGEQMELAATVYNLQEYDLTHLKVRLLGVKGLCSDAVPGGHSEQQYRNLKKWTSWTARWPIVPMKIGEIEITIKLFTTAGRDFVTRYLTVVPSGELVVAPILQITQDPSARNSYQRSWNGSVGSLSYNATRDSRIRMQTLNVPLKLPQDALSDMAIIKVTLLGDIVAPLIADFVNGTEKYLIKPSGCGSQTISKLGPLVFAARYLKEKGKLTAEIRNQIKEHIIAGVNHMKGYQKNDGGFATYNRPGARSYVWLTAFALKTFSQVRASEFMVIDNNVMDKAVYWLLQHRDDSGFFNGYTIHYKTGNILGAAAYVYVALLDAGYYTKHTSDIDSALDILSQRAATENDPFELAIVTYALARYNHPARFSINQRLLSMATNITDAQPMLMSWSRYTNHTEMDVETAGYALLAQVTLGRIMESAPIVEWLVRQRYGGSLFKTTQSTVVALQALVEYSLRSWSDKLDMICTMTFPTVPNRQTHHFTLNDANKLVQQREEVSGHKGKLLALVCKGTGVAYTAIEMAYYTTKSQADNCAFNISAQAIPKDGKVTTIEVCTSVKPAYQNLSMPMLEVGIGTGFTPVIKTLEKLEENLTDLYEVNNRTVVLYMKDIPSEKELCLTFDVVRQENEVKNVRPVPVKVYAYYEPDTTNCRTFYDPLGNETGMLNVKCDSSHRWCKCLENECPHCYGYRSVDQSAAETLHNVTELKDLACNKPHIHYVFAGTVEEVENRNGEVRFTIFIDTVAKQGTESRDLVENELRIFTYPTKCMSCPLDTGRRYLIMGEDGNEKNGEMEYLISHNTYIVPLYPKGKKVWYRGMVYDDCSRVYTTSACNRLKKKPKDQDRRLNQEHKRFLVNLRNATCAT